MGKGGGGGGKPPKDDPPPTIMETEIVYRTLGDGMGLAIADLEGNALTVLPMGFCVQVGQPAWMRDGEHIVFAGICPTDPGGVDETALFRIRIKDGGVLLDSFADPVAVWINQKLETAFPPGIGGPPESDVTHILYAVRDEVSVQSDLWTIALDSDGAAIPGTAGKITDTPWVFEGSGSWSPDGRRIAISTEAVGVGEFEIRVVQLFDVGDPHMMRSLPIADDDGIRLFEDADCGVDGTQPVLCAIRQNGAVTIDWNNLEGDDRLAAWMGGDIYILDIPEAEGSPSVDAVHLTAGNGDASEANPSWSPDDSQIIYSSIGDPCTVTNKPQPTRILAIRNTDLSPASDDCPYVTLVRQEGKGGNAIGPNAPDWLP